MDIRDNKILNYRVYWRKFSGYKGKKMGIRNSTGSWTYGSWDLYKIGHEEVGKDRVQKNKELETVDRWVDLWINIELLDYIDFNCTKPQIKVIEEMIAKGLGKKDFWMEETPSGIKEFMLATRHREELGKEIFTQFKEYKKEQNLN